MSRRFDVLRASARHAWAIAGLIAMVTGVPFAYNLLSKLDLNTDQSKLLLSVVGIAVAFVSFIFGWNDRNATTKADEIGLRDELAGKDKQLASIREELERITEAERESHAVLTARIEDERARHKDDLSRLAKTEEELKKTQMLLDIEKTVSSSYREKYKTAEARLDEMAKTSEAEDRDRKEREEEERKREYARQWVCGLDPRDKQLLLRIHRQGMFVVGPMDEFTLEHTMGNLLRGVDRTALAGHGNQFDWKLTLNELGRCGSEAAMDVLLEAERYGEVSE